MGDNGMDGGLWGIEAFGGGSFQFEICQQQNCCQTKNLNTEDDNWEKYEVNYFVGKQLKGCENFNVTNDSNLTLKIQHSGNDGGKIHIITLLGSKNQIETYHTCFSNKKLDHDQHQTIECNQNHPR